MDWCVCMGHQGQRGAVGPHAPLLLCICIYRGLYICMWMHMVWFCHGPLSHNRCLLIKMGFPCGQRCQGRSWPRYHSTSVHVHACMHSMCYTTHANAHASCMHLNGYTHTHLLSLQHYIRFKTMVEITNTLKHANAYVLLRVLCRADEYAGIRLRYIVCFVQHSVFCTATAVAAAPHTLVNHAPSHNHGPHI